MCSVKAIIWFNRVRFNEGPLYITLTKITLYSSLMFNSCYNHRWIQGNNRGFPSYIKIKQKLTSPSALKFYTIGAPGTFYFPFAPG